jgi:hypothetical protein
MNVVPDHFRILQEGILGTDFLKERRPVDIRCDEQGFVQWRDIRIPCTIQYSVIIPARLAKVFYLKIKNPEIKTGLVPRLDLGEGLYVGNAIVTNRGGKAYIKIANTLDTDRCIDASEVELEKIERIAHHPTKSKHRVKEVRSCAVNVVATDHVPSERNSTVHELLRLYHFKEQEVNHIDRIINKYGDLFGLPDEPLGHTDVTAHKIVTADNRAVNTKQYRFPPIHKNEINKQVKELLNNDIINVSNSPVWVVPKNRI